MNSITFSLFAATAALAAFLAAVLAFVAIATSTFILLGNFAAAAPVGMEAVFESYLIRKVNLVSLSNGAVYLFLQVILAPGTDNLLDGFAALEHRQVGYSLHIICHCESLLEVNVYFCELYFPVILFRKLFECWLHALARPAPVGVKVYDCRDVRLYDLILKINLRHVCEVLLSAFNRSFLHRFLEIAAGKRLVQRVIGIEALEAFLHLAYRADLVAAVGLHFLHNPPGVL